MDHFFGSFILELIGATVKWTYNFLYSYATNSKKISFKEIYDGKKDEKHHEIVLKGVSNTLLGLISGIIIIWIIIWLGL